MDEFQQAVSAVETIPLARQEHPDIPGVRLVHFATLPYFAFYLVDRDDVVVIAVEHDASDYAARVLKRAAGTPP
jgi:plasmid stabilization system protein ParE